MTPPEPSATALDRLAGELGRAGGVDVVLERPARPDHGDYATNAALRAAPALGRTPVEIAEELRERALGLAGVERAEVAPPGFVNLWLGPAWYGEALADMLAAADAYGGGSARTSERIQVELVSANPTAPLTVGSGRNGAYGDSVARLLAFAGHEVEREFYVNDAGSRIDVFRDSVEAERRGEPPPDDAYRGDYIAELAAQPGDPVERMVERIAATLERFRVHVDAWTRQTEIEDGIEEALARLPTYESEGALWVRTTDYGDDKDRVAVRSSGERTYFAADVAYIRHKLERFDRAVYVLGADHHGYVGRLEAIADALGYGRERVDVLIHQLVHLVEGGQAKKMSKRRGDVVFLDELMDEIGADAARWYLVSRGHEQAIEIDVDLAREKSEKNPVYYVQYAHARIAGILRNAGDAGVSPAPPPRLEPEERELVKRLAEFPAVVAEATERRAPHALPTYAVRVADDFHRFYHHHRVLESEAQAFRLALCRATATVVARALDLVGVEAPERM